jgi:hypothetical protein
MVIAPPTTISKLHVFMPGCAHLLSPRSDQVRSGQQLGEEKMDGEVSGLPSGDLT